MKIIKRIVVAASLGMGVVVLVAVVAWLLVADATLVAALVSRLQTVSDTRIDYQGDARITRTLTPTLSFEQLRVEDHAARYRVETRSFRVQLSLPKLLLGQLDIPLLKLGDSRITVTTATAGTESAADPGKTTGMGFPQMRFKPVLHDVQIGNVSLVRDGGEMRLPAIAVDGIEVKLEPDSGTLILTAQTELVGVVLAIDATLPDLHNAVRKRTLGFSILAHNAFLKLGADGQIALDKPMPTLDAEIRARALDLSKIPAGIDALVIPGTLQVTAQVAGTFEQLALENIAAHWKDSGASELQLDGRIDNLTQLDGIQLQLAGKLDQPGWLTPLLPDSVGELHSVELKAGITGTYKQLGIRDFSLHAKTGDELDLSLNGQFDVVPGSAGTRPENIDLKLTFAAPTTHAARALLFDQVPELGAITGNLDIRADADAPALKNIVVKTKDGKGIEVDLSGSIARFPLGPDQSSSGYDLDVTMQAASASIMAKRLGADLPLTGPMHLTYRIEGDTRALALRQISLAAGEQKSVQISAQGQVLFGSWDLADPLQNVDLKLQANSKDTASFNTLLGQQLPALGALSATARLHTVSGQHRVDELRVHNRAGAPVKAALNGSVDEVIFIPQVAVKGIQLKAEFTAADSAQLNSIFGLEDRIPAIGPFKASAVISGSDQQLLIGDVSVTAGQPDILLVNADGRLGNVSAASDWHPRNADLRINARSSSSSALVDLFGYHIPELGPLTAQANMQDKDETLGIESALIQVGEAGAPVIKATGFVADLFGAARTRWDVQLDMDGHTLAAFADQRKLPDLGPLAGRLVIDNSDGSLGMDALEIKTTHTELLSLVVNGHFSDFHHPETLSLDASLSARDLQLIGALFDREWPALGPVQMKSEIRQAGNSTGFDTTLNAGDIHFNAAISGVFESSPPHISGKITAQEFFFPDLLGEVAETAGQEKPKKSQIFSRTPIDLGWLKKADLDLSVDIASFSKENSQLQSAKFVIAQKAGHLSITPATLVYPQGQLDLDFQMDAQEPAQVSFKAYGKNLNPWQTLDLQQGKEDFDTDVDIDVVLKTYGTSLHELAANADGNVYVTMTNGKIRRALLDLVFVNIVGWTYNKAMRDKYSNIDCGVADYGIKQGVLTTNAFLLDTESIAISGEGKIDLGQEQVDYVLLPKKKSRVIGKADPVKITGALNDPSVKVIPWKSAATTYGSLIFAPYIFVGLTAVDYLSGALGVGSKSSPCLDYDQQYKSRNKTSEE